MILPLALALVLLARDRGARSGVQDAWARAALAVGVGIVATRLLGLAALAGLLTAIVLTGVVVGAVAAVR